MKKHPLDHSDRSSSSKRQRRQDGSRPDKQVAPQHLSKNQIDHKRFLCDDCRAVDWSSLPTLAVDGLLENENRVLRSVDASFDELRTSSCRICAILPIIKSRRLDGQPCVLKALPLWRQGTYEGASLFRINRLALESVSQCTVLVVDHARKRGLGCYGPRSLAVVRLSDLSSRKITPSSINYNRLKYLVQNCEKEHKRCHRAESRPNVLGLEVIDTKTQKVIKAPDQCKYLALSYMWGKQVSDGSVHDIQHSPPVVKDAISVTNSMGYNYLWVDRYCIRSDSKERHRMISQMDQIYANASITIIAAADGDTEMGLCGVSRPRQLQRHVNIKNVALLELPLGLEALKFSKWASRGWTYQEGYLSTKRLIFTKNQILFLCNGSYGSECLQKLLNTPCCTNDTTKFAKLIPRFTKTSRRFSVNDLLKHVQEYTVRDLTRSSDSLNAFRGVLSYYANNSAKLTSPVLQLPWGLIAYKHSKKHTRKNTFGLHFFWVHRNGLAVRRSEFPSWSWAGWGGPLKFCQSEITLQPEHRAEQDPFSYLDWEMSMQETDGRIVKMYDLVLDQFKARKVNHRLYQPGPKQLRISCLTTPVRFQQFDFTEDQKNNATEILIHNNGTRVILTGRRLSDSTNLAILQIWKGIYVGRGQVDLKLDQQVEQQDRIIGLIFGGWPSGISETMGCVLLVRQVSDGLYERVGLLNMRGVGMSNGGFLNDLVFLDGTGRVLDKFQISDRQRNHPFEDTAESKTICLV